MSSARLAPSPVFKRSKTRTRFVGRIIGLLGGNEAFEMYVLLKVFGLSSAAAEIFSVFLIAEDLGLDSLGNPPGD
jgi:hypothetical protein